MLNKKKTLIIVIFLIFIILILIGTYKFIKNKNTNIIEYIPEEEISEEQMRKTIISLYFKLGEEIIPEARQIDAKDLISNPYETILNLLIDGPKNSNLENTIPKDTKINKIEKNKNILIIDFSEEFIENHPGGEVNEKITIDSIVNTLTELVEIDEIKILINGQENKSFKDNYINFNNTFKKTN